eukprot:gene4592-4495_t
MVLFFDDLSITDAYFEMVGLDDMPASINIWRHLLSWMGGMGILVLAVAILPLLGVGGSQVFKAETPGPMKDSKLTPRITETAKSLYMVYFMLSVACAISYKLAGMTWLDAFLHTGTTVSLEGQPSLGIEIVDKNNQRELFLQGDAAEKFREEVKYLAAQEPDIDDIEAFIESYKPWMQHPTFALGVVFKAPLLPKQHHLDGIA